MVADFHVGVGRAAIADAVEEVLMMRLQVRAAGSLLSRRVFHAKDLPAASFAENHVTLGAVEGIPVLVTFLHVGRPDPLFEDELLRTSILAVARIFEDHGLRVGELLIVVKEVIPADSGNRGGMRIVADAPPAAIYV